MAVLILSARLPATGPGLVFFGVGACVGRIFSAFLRFLYVLWRTCGVGEEYAAPGKEALLQDIGDPY